MDNELLDSVGQELLDAVHSRDHKKLTEALRALVAHIQLEDERQDEEMISEKPCSFAWSIPILLTP